MTDNSGPSRVPVWCRCWSQFQVLLEQGVVLLVLQRLGNLLRIPESLRGRIRFQTQLVCLTHPCSLILSTLLATEGPGGDGPPFFSSWR